MILRREVSIMGEQSNEKAAWPLQESKIATTMIMHLSLLEAFHFVSEMTDIDACVHGDTSKETYAK